MAKMSLADALKEALQDDNKVSKYEAKVIAQIASSSGYLSGHDRDLLEKALQTDDFDEEAYKLLHELLMREGTR